MYGKWLYKEIGTEYGACMVEIYRKNYTGESIEIGALAADSLSIALENLGSITDPIGKSVCSFSIIDTNQVEYDNFFTPDATALKVVVSTRVGSGAYVTRWSGYVTPDFFAENLSYRTPISISARDNIGYLNDVDFDLTATTITVRELIQSAFTRIAEDYPMQLSFVTKKQTAEGILAIDAIVSTALFSEMTWAEVLETILHDLGLQMRWVDNNTIAVLDLSQIPEYYAVQDFNFIEGSGYREIVPAWRQLDQEQDYGVRENFFDGWLREDNMTFVKEEVVTDNVGGEHRIKLYAPNNWQVSGNTYTINLANYRSISRIDGFTLQTLTGTYREIPFKGFENRIFFTGTKKENTDYSSYMGYRMPIYSGQSPLEITFKALNTYLIPEDDTLHIYNPIDDKIFADSSIPRVQLGIKLNILLHSGVNTYILKEKWEQLTTAETDSITFVLDKIGGVEPYYSATDYDKEQELSINIHSIPVDGELEIRIYGYFIESAEGVSSTYEERAIKYVTFINDVTYAYVNNDNTGQSALVGVNDTHNIKQAESYKIGQVVDNRGNINAFAGGLYYPANTPNPLYPMRGFQRNADAINYNLLELVGRELIHFNKKNYNRLSGTIKNLSKEPLMFNRLFEREGKKYAPYNYSLNVISNEMNITSMQEVELYTTASFSEVHSEVSTGGATVGGGNNTILQYSEDAGNAKRVYELDTAAATEKEDGYVLIDNAGFPEAKKVHISEIKDTQLRSEVEDLRADLDNLNNLLNDDTSGVIDTWNEVVDFLNEYSGSQDLATILSGMNADIAERALQTDLDATNVALNSHIDTYNTFVSATNSTLASHNERIKTFEDVIGIDDKGNVYIKKKADGTARHFYSYGEVSSGGLGSTSEGDGSGSGSTVSWANSYTSANGLKMATITIDGVDTSVYAPKNLSAYNNDTGYLTSVSWGTISDKPTFATVATSGKYSDLSGLPTIPTSLKSPYALTFGSKTYDGSAAKTITASDLGALTSHQSIYALTINNSAGTAQVTYTPNSKAASLTLTKAMVGLGNVENTALSTWAGSTKITTVGTITSGTWNGTKIANGYLANSSVTIAGTSVSLGGSITQAALRTALGLGSNAYTSTAYLPLSGGVIKGVSPYHQYILTLNTDNAYYSILRFQSGGTDKGRLQWANDTNHFKGFGITNDTTGDRLGLSDDGMPFYNTNTLIHSGNIGSQSVNYASSAGNANALNGISSKNYAYYSPGNGYLGFNLNDYTLSPHGQGDGYIEYYDNGAYYNSVWGWVKAIKGFKGNADTATKLQTARTIWGKSFDGSGNVSGNMVDVGSIHPLTDNTYNLGTEALKWKYAYIDVAIMNNTTDGFFIGSRKGLGATDGGALVYSYGSAPISFYTGSERVRILGNGNVLIGTTTDSGYKLDVDGTSRAKVYYAKGLYNYGSSWRNGVGGLNVAVPNDSGQTPLVVGYRTDTSPATAGANRLFAMELLDTGASMRWYFGASFAYSFSSGGTFVAAGDVTSGSDERYKKVISHAEIDINTIANAPIINFKWTDREDARVHLGSTAQYWYGTSLSNGVIPTDDEKLWTMGYGQIALASVVSVAKKVVNHEEEIKNLKKKVNELENELEQYRRA